MLTIFNRAELLITYDLNRFNRVRDALDGVGIDYVYRTKDLTSPTLLEGLAGGSSRGRTGTLGISHDARVEYKLYVHKDQLDWAKTFLY